MNTRNAIFMQLPHIQIKPITRIILCGVITTGILLALFKFGVVSQFVIFVAWAVTFIVLVGATLWQIEKKEKLHILAFLRENWKETLLVLFVAAIPRLLLLGIYPHITLWDELRDAGLRALHLANLKGIELFGFGNYSGYGNFVGLPSYFLLPVFGQSPLIYTIPAAIFGIITIVLFYLLLARYKDKRFALVASVLASVTFILLIFSRTEVCLISDAFLTVLTFWGMLVARKYRAGYFIFGLMSGLTWHFYVASRVILLCLLIILAIYEIYRIVNHLLERDQRWQNLVIHYFSVLVMFCCGVFIALGPTVFFLTKTTAFSQTGTNSLLFTKPQFVELDIPHKIQKVGELYGQAFSTYTFSQIKKHAISFPLLPDALLSFPVNIFFIVGLFVILLRKKEFFAWACAGVVVLYPLFSQVLLNQIGYSHRIVGIVLFANIIAAYGIVFCLEAIEKKKMNHIWQAGFNTICVMALATFSIYQISTFFTSRMVDSHYDKADKMNGEYVFQFALEQIAKDSTLKTYYIENYPPYNFKLLHYTEKIEFFTSPRRVKVLDTAAFLAQMKEAKNSGTTEVFITFSRTGMSYSNDFTTVTYKCSQRYFGMLFDCPKNVSEYQYYYRER